MILEDSFRLRETLHGSNLIDSGQSVPSFRGFRFRRNLVSTFNCFRELSLCRKWHCTCFGDRKVL